MGRIQVQQSWSLFFWIGSSWSGHKTERVQGGFSESRRVAPPPPESPGPCPLRSGRASGPCPAASWTRRPHRLLPAPRHPRPWASERLHREPARGGRPGAFCASGARRFREQLHGEAGHVAAWGVCGSGPLHPRPLLRSSRDPGSCRPLAGLGLTGEVGTGGLLQAPGKDGGQEASCPCPLYSLTQPAVRREPGVHSEAPAGGFGPALLG